MLIHNDLKLQPNGIAAFLRPKINELAVDGPAKAVVDQLERAGWDVPGIDVTFDSYGSGKMKFRLVRKVSGAVAGQRFSIRFSRSQGNAPGASQWNDTAAVSRIVIPRESLDLIENGGYVHADYCLYVGYDWKADEDRFHDSIMVNSKLHGEPRWYVRYTGGPGILQADDDLGREYLPEDGEPDSVPYKTMDSKFAKWIETNLLPYLKSQPTKSDTVDSHFHVERKPYSGQPLYAIVNADAAWRIEQGKNGEGSPEDHYALYSGWRLMPLGSRRALPDVVEDGFSCMLFGDGSNPEFPDWLEPHWQYDSRHVVRIDPKWSNDIWVADFGADDEYVRALRKARREAGIDLSVHLTDDEVWERKASIARTLVPINDYHGSYAKPVVMCNREIALDEVSNPVEINVLSLYRAGKEAYRKAYKEEFEREEAAGHGGAAPSP